MLPDHVDIQATRAFCLGRLDRFDEAYTLLGHIEILSSSPRIRQTRDFLDARKALVLHGMTDPEPKKTTKILYPVLDSTSDSKAELSRKLQSLQENIEREFSEYRERDEDAQRTIQHVQKQMQTKEAALQKAYAKNVDLETLLSELGQEVSDLQQNNFQSTSSQLHVLEWDESIEKFSNAESEIDRLTVLVNERDETLTQVFRKNSDLERRLAESPEETEETAPIELIADTQEVVDSVPENAVPELAPEAGKPLWAPEEVERLRALIEERDQMLIDVHQNMEMLENRLIAMPEPMEAQIAEGETSEVETDASDTIDDEPKLDSEAALAGWQDERENFLKQQDVLMKTVGRHMGHRQKAEQNLADAQSTVESLESKLTSAEAQITAYDQDTSAELDRTSRETGTLRGDLRNAEAGLKTACAKRDALYREKAGWETKIRAAEEATAEKERLISVEQTLSSELQILISQQQREKRELENERDSLKTERDKLSAELESSSNQTDATQEEDADSWAQQLESAITEKERALQELEHLREQLSSLEASIPETPPDANPEATVTDSLVSAEREELTAQVEHLRMGLKAADIRWAGVVARAAILEKGSRDAHSANERSEVLAEKLASANSRWAHALAHYAVEEKQHRETLHAASVVADARLEDLNFANARWAQAMARSAVTLKKLSEIDTDRQSAAVLEEKLRASDTRWATSLARAAVREKTLQDQASDSTELDSRTDQLKQANTRWAYALARSVTLDKMLHDTLDAQPDVDAFNAQLSDSERRWARAQAHSAVVDKALRDLRADRDEINNARSTLETEMESLQTTLSEYENTIKGLTEEISETSESLEAVRSELESGVAETTSLKDSRGEALARLDEQGGQLKSLEESKQSVLELLAHTEAERDDMRAFLATTTFELEELENREKALKADLGAAEDTIDVGVNDLAALKTAYENLETGHGEEREKEREADRDALLKEREESQAKADITDSELARITSELNSAVESRTALESDLAEAQRFIEQHKSEIGELKTTRAEDETAVSAVESRLAEQQTKSQEFESRLEASERGESELREQLEQQEDVRTGLESSVEELNTRIATLNDELSEKTLDLETREADLIKTKEESEHNQLNQNRIQSDLDKLESANEQLSQSLNDVERKLNDADSKVLGAQDEQKSLEGVLVERDSRISNLSQVQLDLKQSISGLTQDKSERDAQISQLSRQKTDLQNDLTELQSVSGTLREQESDARRLVVEHEAQLLEMTRSIRESRAETSASSQQIEMLRTDMRTIKDDLSSVRNEKDASAGRVRELEVHLENITHDYENLEKKIELSQADIEDSQSDLLDMQAELNQSEVRESDIARAMVTKDNEIESLEHTITNFEAKIESLSDEISDGSLAKVSLNSDMGKLRGEIGTLGSDLIDAREAQANQENPIKEMQEEWESIRHKELPEALEQKVAALRECQRLRSEIEMLRKQLW